MDAVALGQFRRSCLDRKYPYTYFFSCLLFYAWRRRKYIWTTLEYIYSYKSQLALEHKR